MFLVEADNTVIKFPYLKNGKREIYCHNTLGPIFGSKSDLYISNNCNKNKDSYTDVGYSFEKQYDIQHLDYTIDDGDIKCHKYF